VRDPIVIVGSGASGVHFAWSAVERGRKVRLLDVGYPRPEPVLPGEDLNGLKAKLDDPVAWLLGEEYGSLVLPGAKGEYYGFPPSKDHVFRNDGVLSHRASGFAPLFSFAAGGLAEAWTGGSYPFTDADLEDYPFGWDEIAPFYGLVARRIGVSGTVDDLASFFPEHDGLLPPLDLDEHSRRLLEAYRRRRSWLNRRLRASVGRARLATLSRDHDGRPACDYTGRCLWGCPTGSLWTPSLALERLRQKEGFEYADGLRVERFTLGDDGLVRTVVARDLATGAERSFEAGTLVLAAGTLGSAKILLDSIRRETGTVERLAGLTDNRQLLMPFVNRKLVGRPWEPRSYQYHQLAIAVDADRARDQLHGLVTTLKTAMIHPIVQSLPVSVGTALAVVRNLHAALGLVNVNFADRRREESGVTIEEDGPGRPTRLVIEYRPPDDEPERIARAVRTFRRILGKLGCTAPKGMVHRRPMGAGTVPMCREGGRLTTDENGRSRDFGNLYLVDGSTFPSLPAKNLTFTLMANAARIAANTL